MTSTAIITKTYQDNAAVLTFREDGWFNMTKAAKAFGKDLSNFMRLPSTIEYCEALSNSVISTELTEAKSGRYHGGTWAHPKLAVFFARWLDTKFAVWCDAVIDDILRGHQTLRMVNKAASAVEALPVEVKDAGTAWQAQMQAALKTLQATVEAQATALTEAKALLKGFMLKQEDSAKNSEYMSIGEYLELVNLHLVEVHVMKKMRDSATAYCQRRGIPVGSFVRKFQGKDLVVSTYPKHALSHALEIAYYFDSDESEAF